jgi:hypothetical protein
MGDRFQGFQRILLCQAGKGQAQADRKTRQDHFGHELRRSCTVILSLLENSSCVILGGAALQRCDNWLVFDAGFSR